MYAHISVVDFLNLTATHALLPVGLSVQLVCLDEDDSVLGALCRKDQKITGHSLALLHVDNVTHLEVLAFFPDKPILKLSLLIFFRILI